MDKSKVDIFIGPIACSCAVGPSPAKQEKIARAFALKSALEEHDGSELHTFRLGEDDDYEEGFALLKRYLTEAGEEELSRSLAFSINDATGSVAVEGRLRYLADAPPPERFFKDIGG